MAFEIIIGIFLIALCALSGRAAAMKRVYEADELANMQSDIELLKMLTLEKRQPVKQALSNLHYPAFKNMSLQLEKDDAVFVKDAWTRASEEAKTDERAREILDNLFEAAENLSRAFQEAQYDRALEALKALEWDKRKAGMEKVKLYTSLGAVAGVCALIFCV